MKAGFNPEYLNAPFEQAIAFNMQTNEGVRICFKRDPDFIRPKTGDKFDQGQIEYTCFYDPVPNRFKSEQDFMDNKWIEQYLIYHDNQIEVPNQTLTQQKTK